MTRAALATRLTLTAAALLLPAPSPSCGSAPDIADEFARYGVK